VIIKATKLGIIKRLRYAHIEEVYLNQNKLIGIQRLISSIKFNLITEQVMGDFFYNIKIIGQ